MKKKILAAVLAIVMILALASCSNSVDEAYDYDLSEYVKVGPYTGLDVAYKDVTVAQTDIDAALASALQAAAVAEKITTGTVADGDSLIIDYKGTIDGKAFEGGTAAGQALVVGSGSMIPGFEEQIIGKKIGSTFTIDVTFPDDYASEELKSAKAQFEITVQSKQGELITPEFNEEFVKNNSDFKTTEEYMADLEKSVYKQKEDQEIANVQNTIWSKIVDSSEVTSYPEAELQKRIDQNKEYYQSYADQYGMEFPEFLTTYVGMTEEEFADYAKQQAEVICKQEMILYTIARSEDIKISSKEYDEGLMNMLKEQGFDTLEDFEKAYGKPFEEYAGKDNITTTLLLDKVMEWLIKENVTNMPA